MFLNLTPTPKIAPKDQKIAPKGPKKCRRGPKLDMSRFDPSNFLFFVVYTVNP